MSKPMNNDPPFTVTRYGSLGAATCAERDWLRAELDAAKTLGQKIDDELASAQRRIANMENEMRELVLANVLLKAELDHYADEG